MDRTGWGLAFVLGETLRERRNTYPRMVHCFVYMPAYSKIRVFSRRSRADRPQDPELSPIRGNYIPSP